MLSSLLSAACNASQTLQSDSVFRFGFFEFENSLPRLFESRANFFEAQAQSFPDSPQPSSLWSCFVPGVFERCECPIQLLKPEFLEFLPHDVVPL